MEKPWLIKPCEVVRGLCSRTPEVESAQAAGFAVHRNARRAAFVPRRGQVAAREGQGAPGGQ